MSHNDYTQSSMTEAVYVNICCGTILLCKTLENIVWRLVGNLMMGKIDPSAYLYKNIWYD